MLAAGEDELICDMAQTYHVYDWRGLPLKTAAALAAGLPEDARTRKKMENRAYDSRELWLAMIVDSLRWLQWARTTDGHKGRNQPESIAEKLLRKTEEKNTPRGGYTPEEFAEAYKRATGEEFVIGR